MQSLKGLVARFGRDESGVFAVLFGLMAIVLIAMGGAVVDYVALEQTRNRAQVALDAAALSLQPEIFDTTVTQEQIRQRAQALVIDRIADARVTATVDGIIIDQNEGSLLLSGRLEMPTMFVSLVGVPDMAARFTAEATRKQLALEVVMVLDNSASMLQENRMTYLKEAANCATYTLFYSEVEDVQNNANTCINTQDAELVENVKVGIVPFTMFVNVDTSNRNAAWLDKTGASSIANDNFDDDDNASTPFTGTVNRLALFDNVKEAWRGCVEARPHTASGTESTEFLDTDDTLPTGGDTLFVPLFSPDLPDNVSSFGTGQSYLTDSPAACQYPGTCSRTVRDSSCNSSYSSCDTTTNGAWSLSGPKGKTGSLSCSCTGSTTYTAWTYGESGTGTRRYWRQRIQSCTYNYQAQGLSSRERQERLCKYTGTVANSGFSTGPNADCTREPILPLTDSVDDVLETIDDMVAAGGTNIHEGTAWGYRVLSPGEPFTEAEDYEQATSKVLIIMTDGENTAYNINGNATQNAIRSLNGSIWYSAYGWPYNARLGTLGTSNANLVTAMNERTKQTCANAKRSLTGDGPDKIRIYTIGLATDTVTQSTPAVVRQMLTDCASAPSMAYFPQTPSELKTVFATIADELAALRLAQ